VYWIPLHQILEERGLEVYLVNAQYVKNVPGRKSDVSDCQWIQYLHSVGLLRASFRPPAAICAIRSFWRHRENLIQMGAQHVRFIQKALDQMNLQIHHVLSDITGVSGQRILDAILGGQRDPVGLATLCHGGVKTSQVIIAKALEGDYRVEHLFALKQSLFSYRYYQRMIADVDVEIESHLATLPTSKGAKPDRPPGTKKRIYQRQHYEPAFNLPKELYRIMGVDLTDVPGISAVTAHTILSEIGADVSQFRNASAFASWLGLCPEKQISGGKVLYTKTRTVRNRVANALRLGAHSLHHAKNYLGEFFRRMRRKLGPAQAITAIAHKLARIVFHLLSTGQAYDETVFQKYDHQTQQRAELRLRRQAAQLGFQIIPIGPEQA
jgi:transposase